jgi:hypothetical protein
MKRFVVALAVAATLALPTAGVALADDPHSAGSTGQPSQHCQDTTPPAFPGQSGSSPGSAFNGTAGNVYTSYPNGQGAISSGNPKANAQYDVACFQQASHAN